MEIKKKSSISIYKLFLIYLIRLVTAIITSIIVLYFLASIVINAGIIFPANYTETRLNQLESTLQNDFDKNLLPANCSYIIIDTAGNIADSNMSESDINKVKTHLQNGQKPYYILYKIIYQSNGNVLIIKYDIIAHFSNPLLNKILPYPEFFVLFLLLMLIVLFTIITASKFSKKLKRNLNPILKATKNIEQQNLDFDIIPTEITELNSILDSVDQLKNALSYSLKEQWDKEQQKKSQISALAHDIKTPLTVIKGNAELLGESNLPESDKDCVAFIQSSSKIIEQYLELLMNTLNNNSFEINLSMIPLKDFLADLFTEASSICKVKHIKLFMQNTSNVKTIYADWNLLKRALINIIDNSVRYSNENSEININIAEDDLYISFHIEDYGRGFSIESLKHATQEFYSEDSARTNKHYGLGLNFAKTVASMHHGTISIANHTSTGGAVVSLTIKND